jgi:hypothetical protein
MQQCYNYVHILSSLPLCSLKKNYILFILKILFSYLHLYRTIMFSAHLFLNHCTLIIENPKAGQDIPISFFFNSGMTNFLLYCGTDCCNYSFLPSGGCILCILCAISRKSSPRICRNWYLHFRGKPAELHFHCILFMILKDQCLWHKLLFA